MDETIGSIWQIHKIGEDGHGVDVYELMKHDDEVKVMAVGYFSDVEAFIVMKPGDLYLEPGAKDYLSYEQYRQIEKDVQAWIDDEPGTG